MAKGKRPFNVDDIVQLREEFRNDWRKEIRSLADVQMRVDDIRRDSTESGWAVTVKRGDNGKYRKGYDAGFFELACQQEPSR